MARGIYRVEIVFLSIMIFTFEIISNPALPHSS